MLGGVARTDKFDDPKTYLCDRGQEILRPVPSTGYWLVYVQVAESLGRGEGLTKLAEFRSSVRAPRGIADIVVDVEFAPCSSEEDADWLDSRLAAEVH